MITDRRASVNIQEADAHLSCLESKLKDIFWEATSNDDITAEDLVRFRSDLQEVKNHARRIFGCCSDLACALDAAKKEAEE